MSSAQGKESDRQYIRLWESASPGHPRSLLYFATARSHRKYIEIDDLQDFIHALFAASQMRYTLEHSTLAKRLGFTPGSLLRIFAVGIIIPMLSHVYWHGAMPATIETAMRAATLVGTIIGQYAFGVLADLYGRRKMYGLELLVVIVATVGVTMASDGASKSMNLVGWLISWRFLMGIGIGGDYPLSAVITSEFAPTKSRARMIATVFFMQPCGYLVATLVALFATLANKNGLPTNIPTDVDSIISCTDDELCRRTIDRIWRWVIGAGAIPAAIAILFRISIPESPRYTMEVLNRPDEALEDVNEMGWKRAGRTPHHAPDLELQTSDSRNLAGNIPTTTLAGVSKQTTNQEAANNKNKSCSNVSEMVEHQILGNLGGNARSGSISSPNVPPPISGASSITTIDEPDNRPAEGDDDSDIGEEKPSEWERFYTGFVEHFFTKGHWPTLLGTSLSWACFDFAYYALGPNSYKVISKIFNEKPLKFTREPGGTPLHLPTRSIYTDLVENSWHSLIIVSIGSMIGGLGMIKLTKRISPRTVQLFGFLVLTAILIAIGISFETVSRHASVPLIAFLYVLSQIFFEIGPNFTTFMIPAELFPTRFRCTAHGISAAAGKIASVVVQAFVAYSPIGPYRSSDPAAEWLGYVIVIFAAFMLLGAAVTKWLIPETRERDGSNKPLEQLEDVAKVKRPIRFSCVSARKGVGVPADQLGG
ncbi:phosphate transporter [Histoplasma capsulatum H143]|uniref:Phosphate transporter n=1 Tax=Ajellomyces capsulatus (strain H143) TaxID=544712 RepID=C6HPB6_AJECH|nr:phosphate transporter [Histoplasma capsulatum H143]